MAVPLVKGDVIKRLEMSTTIPFSPVERIEIISVDLTLHGLACSFITNVFLRRMFSYQSKSHNSFIHYFLHVFYLDQGPKYIVITQDNRSSLIRHAAKAASCSA